MNKSSGVDPSEMRERLRRQRRAHRGRRWYDLGDHLLTDEERELLLTGLHHTKLFIPHTLQHTIDTVAEGTAEFGMTFDEALHYYYLCHVGPSPLHIHD